jgi:hypothetical protein
VKKIPIGIVGALLAGAFLTLSCARSTGLLRGSEAEEFLAGKLHLAEPGRYTFLALENRQTPILMAAVFNRDRGGENSGNFEVVRREKSMGYHSDDNPFSVVVLNSSSGKLGIEPDEGIIEEIHRARLSPAVVLNAEGEEEAVVYLPAGQRLAAFLRPDGEIRLELGFRGPGEGDIRYSLELEGDSQSTTETSSRREEKKEKTKMSTIKIGDLVQWETGAKTRVGVVKSIDGGGIATINVPTTGGSREEKIKAERLQVITSTIESE